jgi:hypothetical protein
MNAPLINGQDVADAIQSAIKAVPAILHKHLDLAKKYKASDINFIRMVASARIFLDSVIVKGQTPDDVLSHADKWLLENGVDTTSIDGLIVAACYGWSRYTLDEAGNFTCAAIPGFPPDEAAKYPYAVESNPETPHRLYRVMRLMDAGEIIPHDSSLPLHSNMPSGARATLDHMSTWLDIYDHIYLMCEMYGPPGSHAAKLNATGMDWILLPPEFAPYGCGTTSYLLAYPWNAKCLFEMGQKLDAAASTKRPAQ